MAYWVNVLDLALVTTVFVVALNVVLGCAGLLSIAPAGLGGVGGYIAAYLSSAHGVGFVGALAAGMGTALVVGIMLGFPALRLAQDYLILLTLAFATVVVDILVAIPAFGGMYGIVGLKAIQFDGALISAGQLFRVIALIAAICIGICWRMSASPFGRVLRGIREDEVATQALGKSVMNVKLLVFAVTSAVMGVGGVLLVYYSLIASTTLFDFNQTTTMVAAVVIGGMGSMVGAVVGAFLLTFLGPVLQKTVNLSPTVSSVWQLTIYGSLLILVVRVMPGGLVPEGTSVRRVISVLRRLGDPSTFRAQPLAAGDAQAGVSLGGVGSEPQPRVERGVGSDPVAVSLEADRPKGPLSDLRTRDVGHEQPIAAGITERQPETQSVAETEPVIVVRGLSKSFGGIRAVRELDLEVAGGRVTALLGPNGAGKTTVFNLITGRIRPDAGQVFLRGKEISGLRPDEVARLGMVRSFQDVRTFLKLTLLDNVALGVPDQPGENLVNLFGRPLASRRAESETRERAMECLRFVGLEKRANEYAAKLGFGDQKLLSMARLLATGGEVLLVDEPTSGIDRNNVEPLLNVIDRLRQQGKTICLVEHNLEVVTVLADHVLFMEDGRVTAEGTMAEIRQQERLADVYFGHA